MEKSNDARPAKLVPIRGGGGRGLPPPPAVALPQPPRASRRQEPPSAYKVSSAHQKILRASTDLVLALNVLKKDKDAKAKAQAEASGSAVQKEETSVKDKADYWDSLMALSDPEDGMFDVHISQLSLEIPASSLMELAGMFAARKRYENGVAELGITEHISVFGKSHLGDMEPKWICRYCKRMFTRPLAFALKHLSTEYSARQKEGCQYISRAIRDEVKELYKDYAARKAPAPAAAAPAAAAPAAEEAAPAAAAAEEAAPAAED